MESSAVVFIVSDRVANLPAYETCHDNWLTWKIIISFMLWCSVLKWSGIAQRLYEAAAILFKVWLHTIKEENKTFELDIDKHVHHTHAYTKDT